VRDPVDIDVPVHYRLPSTQLEALVHTIATTVSVKPVNASIGIEADQSDITFLHAHAGRTLNERAAIVAIGRAVHAGHSGVVLHPQALAPKVPDAKLGRTIVVHLDQNRLYLYEGFHV